MTLEQQANRIFRQDLLVKKSQRADLVGYAKRLIALAWIYDDELGLSCHDFDDLMVIIQKQIRMRMHARLGKM